MIPPQRLFSGSISIIRPLAYLDEKGIISYCRLKNLLVDQPSCRFVASDQKRIQIRIVLAEHSSIVKKGEPVEVELFDYDPAATFSIAIGSIFD